MAQAIPRRDQPPSRKPTPEQREAKRQAAYRAAIAANVAKAPPLTQAQRTKLRALLGVKPAPRQRFGS